MKFLKIVILFVIPLGIYLFIDNFPPGYYLDQRNLPYKLYVSFFNDLAMPFGLYFVLCLFEKWIPRLKPWWAKVLLVFLALTILEFGQYFYYIFSSSQYVGSFDPFDILCYAIGGLSAALLERQVFAKYFRFWENSSAPANAY